MNPSFPPQQEFSSVPSTPSSSTLEGAVSLGMAVSAVPPVPGSILLSLPPSYTPVPGICSLTQLGPIKDRASTDWDWEYILQGLLQLSQVCIWNTEELCCSSCWLSNGQKCVLKNHWRAWTMGRLKLFRVNTNFRTGSLTWAKALSFHKWPSQFTVPFATSFSTEEFSFWVYVFIRIFL